MHLFIFRELAMMCLNDEGLTNLDGSIIFNVRRLAMLLDPSKPG